MSFFNKKLQHTNVLVTHDGTFHADDIFATAALSLFLIGDIEVVRTRDEKKIANADFVYDVGGIYDPATNRFDHHQKGGAGKRENGIPYAAFGLVWKTYGEKICGSKEIADKIDESLVQAIDANDNGLDMYTVEGEVGPYTIEHMFAAFRPSWKEGEESDAPFMKLVEFAKEFLVRKITKDRDASEAESFVKSAYEKAPDKRLIVLDGNYPWKDVIMEHAETLYIVGPKMGKWNLYCVQKEERSFENRKPLPEAWAGLKDQDLAEVSGVPDAIFCHNARFLAVAKSKEGVVALAQKALLA